MAGLERLPAPGAATREMKVNEKRRRPAVVQHEIRHQRVDDRAGFRVLTDQPFNDKQRWIELRVGASDTRVVLFVFDEQGLKPGMMFNGALACDNVEQTYQELVAKGVEFVTPPTKQPWGMFAVFKDLDDNQFLLSSK